MIKKLILYTGGIETLMYFSLQLGEAFERRGYEIFYYDLRDELSSIEGLRSFVTEGETASVGFNFNGCSGEDFLYDKNGIHLFDFLQIPMINIVVDHPFYYHKFLPYLPRDYTQLSIDLEHEEYLSRFFPEIRRGPFLPLAGTQITTKPCPGFDDRSIDILFVGNYNPPEKQDPVLARNGPEYEHFYRELIRDFIEHPWLELTTTIEKHLRENFADELTEESLKDTFPYMIMIDLYIRHYFRAEVVRTLVDGGLSVTVYGKGWETLPCEHPENLIIHDNVDSLTCLKRICEAKVSLNVMPWFKRGAHDRIFNSMLNGAVCVTDPSQYLEQELTDGEDVIFYRLEELHRLPEQVRSILQNKEKWMHLQSRAYEKAAARHTWDHRAERIHRELLLGV